MTVFGREAHFPMTGIDWLHIGVILLVIALCFRLVSGWSTSILGVSAAFASYLYDHHLYLPLIIAATGIVAVARGIRPGDSPTGWRAAREVLLVSTGFFFYEWGRSRLVGSESHAEVNASRVIDAERRAGLFIEGSLQRFVLHNDNVVSVFNWIYSFAFLSMVIGALLYLYVADLEAYRIYRTSLGISALLALMTIALFPVAPPRLMPDSGLLDTHDLLGRAHGFVNEFAAMPSLHVGWVALAGFSLSRTARGVARWMWATIPALIMLTTVVATGNHYWLDGVVGACYTLIPAVALTFWTSKGEEGTLSIPRRFSVGTHAQPANQWSASMKTRVSLVSLGSLLIYLLVRHEFNPHFTDYWGYMVGQLAATIVILVWLDDEFSPEGGLSWFTHIVVIVNTWADSLGTAAHLYDKYVSYDKITHFLGGVMLTAAVADVLFALQQRNGGTGSTFRVLAIAVFVSVGLGTAWEFYEYLGDRVFDTGRHAGAVDTWYDLTSDTVGAIVSVFLLWRWRAAVAAREQPAQFAGQPRGAD
jgi:hypothetical protein